MTSNSFVNTRHVPEEELHAYLDQALSRSQCVEIERHLAVCGPCSESRDHIAALRDRTTALLAHLAPPVIHTPPLADLRQRHAERTARRQRMARIGAWAASVVLALGLGWSAHTLAPSGGSGSAGPVTPLPSPTSLAVTPGTTLDPTGTGPGLTPPAQPTARPTAPTGGPRSDGSPGALHQVADATRQAPTPAAATAAAAPKFRATLSQKPLLRVTSSSLSEDELSEGLWRSLSWDGAREQTGDDWIPRVQGLPVVDVQVKQSDQEDSKPLMVVSQRLSSGQVIKTFSGSVDEVTDLLARQPGQSVTAALQILDNADSLAAGDSLARQAAHGAERMLAIQGSISADSLRTLLLRLH